MGQRAEGTNFRPGGEAAMNRHSLKSSLRPEVVVLALAAALFVGAAGWNLVQQRNLHDLESTAPVPAVVRTVPQSQGDFVRTLPRRFEMQSQHRLVEGAGEHAGVIVRSFSMETAAARRDALGRLNCHVLAAGSYSKLKAFMGELLSRSPAAHMQHASFKASGSGGELELRLDWQLLSQPIQTETEKSHD
jgi:hypothetical protein